MQFGYGGSRLGEGEISEVVGCAHLLGRVRVVVVGEADLGGGEVEGQARDCLGDVVVQIVCNAAPLGFLCRDGRCDEIFLFVLVLGERGRQAFDLHLQVY